MAGCRGASLRGASDELGLAAGDANKSIKTYICPLYGQFTFQISPAGIVNRINSSAI
jgi:hypothetical protein